MMEIIKMKPAEYVWQNRFYGVWADSPDIDLAWQDAVDEFECERIYADLTCDDCEVMHAPCYRCAEARRDWILDKQAENEERQMEELLDEWGDLVREVNALDK